MDSQYFAGFFCAASPQDFDFRIMLAGIHRADHPRHSALGLAACPYIDPALIRVQRAFQVTVIERVDEVWVAWMTGAARPVNHQAPLTHQGIHALPVFALLKIIRLEIVRL